ncbi:hypothetical protein COLO4_27257 [Corchorus olitorius]|uniref:Uncharacterized protein n=1 Tax=Corchorus olitorius TaxID=93759 RepID=A0A1R3HRR9_9ROSI|nr:hypothetical protein COLO4_27257 [Corchorus olitorius]
METAVNLSNSVSPGQLDIHQGLNDISIPFPRLPDLQTPCEYQTSTNNKDMGQAQEYSVQLSQGENTTCNSSSPWLNTPSETPSPNSVAASATDHQTLMINNLGDASSISPSYGGAASSSVWADNLLFEDPLLFHEIS